MPIIEVNHLTKEYRLGAMQGIKQTLLNTAARLTGKKVEERPLFKALDDVNFSIEQGEVVGIIGHNGAGKSTLLKMLAKISTPTHGSVKITGRIAPLIEVGAGFVPDFTGRENVYLNGAILGMSRQEIDKKFDEIVDFAEMAEFIDTPVKRYSSGMQVKLAFAVATSIESEILIVDEVLAVGDLAFQRKCFDRMEDLIKRQGRTVLLVSHNLRHVERICSRVLLLDHGGVIKDGLPHTVCDLFFEKNDEKIIQNKQSSSTEQSRVLTSGEAELLDVQLLDATGVPTNTVTQGKDVIISVTYQTNRELTKPVFVLGIHTVDFIYLATTRSLGQISKEKIEDGIYKVDCLIRNFPFTPGVYAFRVDLIVGDLYSTAFHAENIKPFKVISQDVNRAENDAEGFIILDAMWTLREADQPLAGPM